MLAEHSPIRVVEYRVEWENVPYWVVMHLVRHHVNVLPFVGTQRTDRTGVDRDDLPQSNPIRYAVRLNAQCFINISRKRCCTNASPETRHAWQIALDQLEQIDPILRKVCVRECLYRGFCPELKKCGYNKNPNFQNELNVYRGEFNG